MAAPELRPMGIGDILDSAFRLYRANFLTFLTIALVAYVPYSVVAAAFQTYAASLQPQPTSPGPFGNPFSPTGQSTATLAAAQTNMPRQFDSSPPVGPPQLAGLFTGLIGFLLFTIVVIPLCQGALTHNISATYLGEQLGAWDSYRRAAPRLLTLIVASFLAGLVIMLGMCLLVVPGIIFAFWFYLVGPVVMLERHGITSSLGRSRELMRGNLGKAFMLGLVVFLLMFAVNFGLGMAIGVIPWPHLFFHSFFANLVPALTLPIQVATAILLYYDIRIRKEAFDLQVLATNLGAPALA